MPSPVRMMVGLDQLNVEAIISSSPVKLIVGGRAIFIRLARSHQDVIRGKISCSPRASRSVRLWVRS